MTLPTTTTSSFVTLEELRGALEFLSRRPQNERVALPPERGGGSMTIAEMFRGRSVDEILDLVEIEDDQDEARWVVEAARRRGYGKRTMLPWILGGVLVLGGTWFAVRLVRNGRG